MARFLYHHKLAPNGKVFERCEDEPQGWWKRRGWVDTPKKFPRPSRMKTVVKPWWEEWNWLVTPITAILVLLAAVVELYRAFND